MGGGPSGLATALHLVAKEPALAERLVVLEGARYPRDKFCAGAISARAELDLGSIGVVVDVPAAPVTTIAALMPGGRVASSAGTIGRVVRRSEFDAELARIARTRGIRIVEGARVSGIDIQPDGVRITSSAGEHLARVVVGADGVGSIVRRALGLGAATWRAQVLEVDTERVSTDAADTLLFDVQDRGFDGYAWDFPTLVEGQPLVCRGVYHLALPGRGFGSVDLAGRLSARLARDGLDLSKCKKKRFAERGFSPHEPGARPRVLLVGEAAGVDPITGEGIAQALLYGRVAADYLVDKLPGGDLSFGDWSARLAKTPLGRDLWLRHFLALRFFGPARGFYEDALLALPSFLDLGVRYFAGARLSRGALLELGVRASLRLFRERHRSPLDGLDPPTDTAAVRPAVTPYS